jgi:hypothetical protein
MSEPVHQGSPPKPSAVFGALLIGTLLNVFFYMLYLQEAVSYAFRFGRKDAFRYWVLVMSIVLTLSAISATSGVCGSLAWPALRSLTLFYLDLYTVSHWGDRAYVFGASPIWQSSAGPASTGAACFCLHTFLLFRIWKL